MLQGKTEQGAFFADHAAGGGGHCQGLGRNHLAHDAAAGIGCTGENRVDAQLFSCSLLQTAKENVARGVGAGAAVATGAGVWAGAAAGVIAAATVGVTMKSLSASPAVLLSVAARVPRTGSFTLTPK